MAALAALHVGCAAEESTPVPSKDAAPRAEAVYYAGRIYAAEAQRGTPDYEAGLEPASTPMPGRTEGWEQERIWSDHVDWEPVVAVDRSSDRVYQLVARYYALPCPDCPDPILAFRRSDDGGATWGEDRYPFRSGRTLGDPQLQVAGDGTVFAAFLQDYRPGVVLARSEDGGDTWSEPVRVTGESKPRWSDHPLLMVSDDGRDVYVALNASDSYIVASHDGGQTFAAPVRTNPGGRYWFHTGGVVRPDGSVFVAAVDFSQNYTGNAHVSVLRSEDGGRSWETIRLDVSAEVPACDWSDGCYLGYLGPRASLAADTDGALLVVYNAGNRPGRPQRLWYRTSADGRMWSRRQRLAPGPASTSFAFPVVASGLAAGDFRVAWQDDRRAPTERWNTWMRQTTDGGATWERRVQLSGGGARPMYKSASGYAFPYGDYIGLAVDGQGLSHVIWGAGESYYGNGGAWYTRGR